MKKKIAVVTGATGCIGRNVVEALDKDIWEVICLHRYKSKTFEMSGVDWRQADLLDDLAGAIPYEADAVFHCAGNVSHKRRDRVMQYRVNVEGTKELIREAERAKVGRFIFTSTGATWGLQGADRQLTEKEPQHYVRSKRLAEIALAESSLDHVVIHPIIVIGTHDTRNYVKLFQQAASGRMPRVLPGRIVFNDAHDVGKAHMLAYWHAEPASHHLLHGHYLSWVELFSRVVGAKHIKGELKRWQLYLAAMLPGNELTLDLVKLLRDAPDVSDMEKLRNRSIHYRPRSLHETIAAARNGILRINV